MIMQIIQERSSVRDFSNKKISEIEIKSILEAARLAPSWMNVQPWHFICISDEHTKKLISKLANGQKQIEKASHIILTIADLNAWNQEKFGKVLAQREGMSEEKIDLIFKTPFLYPKLQGENTLLLRSVEQCTYAVAYMTLQAKSLGIDSCIIGAFGNELTDCNQDLSEEIKQLLQIPKNNYLITILALGYNKEANKPSKKLRKDFNQIISKEKYNQNF